MQHKSGPSSGRQNNNSNSQGFKRKKVSGPGTPYAKSGGEKRSGSSFDKDKKNEGGFAKRDFTSSEGQGEKRPFRKTDDKKPFQRSSDSSFGKSAGDKPFGKRPPRSFDGPDQPRRSDDDASGEKRPFRKTEGGKPFERKAPGRKFDGPRNESGEGRPSRFERKDNDGAEGKRPFSRDEKKSYSRDDKKPFSRDDKKPFSRDDKKPYKKDDRSSTDEKRPFKPYSKEGFSPRIEDDSRKRKTDKSGDGGSFNKGADRPVRKRIDKTDEKRPFKRPAGSGGSGDDKKKQRPDHDQQMQLLSKKILHEDDDDDFDEEAINAGIPKKRTKAPKEEGSDNMPLNKYLAHSGVCSRRDAANLVREGKVKVNDVLVLDPGHKVLPADVVTMGDKKLTIQKGMVYILLNKPKDYITTNEDPQGRKTVMDLVEGADAERLFPVGRLDRNTSGLLLITNDGDLTQKLAHPAYNIKKVYHVTLDKPLTKADSEKIIAGLELEDGIAQVDALAFLEAKNELGIEIHSGKNRIVRRIFESLGYVVEKLDRMMYAGLTKKNLPRGKWRYLNEREIILLKHFKS